MNKEEAFEICKKEFAVYCTRYPILCKKIHDDYIKQHFNKEEALAKVCLLLLKFSWHEDNILIELGLL